MWHLGRKRHVQPDKLVMQWGCKWLWMAFSSGRRRVPTDGYTTNTGVGGACMYYTTSSSVVLEEGGIMHARRSMNTLDIRWAVWRQQSGPGAAAMDSSSQAAVESR